MLLSSICVGVGCRRKLIRKTIDIQTLRFGRVSTISDRLYRRVISWRVRPVPDRLRMSFVYSPVLRLRMTAVTI